MKQAKGIFDDNFEQNKPSNNGFSPQKFSEESLNSQDSNLVLINNRKELQDSLKDSVRKHVSQIRSKIFSCQSLLNCIAFFLQELWNEIIPDYFKGQFIGQIKSSPAYFYEAMRKSGNLLDHGSMAYSLSICKRRKKSFLIAVLDKSENLTTLPLHITQRIKKYALIPIQKSRRKQLQQLCLSPRTASKVTFFLCHFNFAGQLGIFCQLDGETNQDLFELSLSFGEFSIIQYIQLEERTLHCLRNNRSYFNFDDALQRI